MIRPGKTTRSLRVEPPVPLASRDHLALPVGDSCLLRIDRAEQALVADLGDAHERPRDSSHLEGAPDGDRIFSLNIYEDLSFVGQPLTVADDEVASLLGSWRRANHTGVPRHVGDVEDVVAAAGVQVNSMMVSAKSSRLMMLGSSSIVTKPRSKSRTSSIM